ncbi:MAG: hypothetical protein WCC60_15515 [Ilumatobacteraceae bacterium]
MSGSANERSDCSHQLPTAASDSTEAGAEDPADMATHVGYATRHGGSATSDPTRSAPDGLHYSSADCGKALAHPPNYSEREAGSAHKGANQPHPQGSDSSTGTRSQPLEPGGDVPGERNDHTGHPAQRVTQAPQHNANRV